MVKKEINRNVPNRGLRVKKLSNKLMKGTTRQGKFKTLKGQKLTADAKIQLKEILSYPKSMRNALIVIQKKIMEVCGQFANLNNSEVGWSVITLWYENWMPLSLKSNDPDAYELTKNQHATSFDLSNDEDL